jgi:ATP/maltotriose-dependent transcriptional regulator MalT/DNA-binding SARP family transcriptional activator
MASSGAGVLSQPPHSSSIINRPRLLDKLMRSADYRLTLISAPPGYGKTTLAAQFARAATSPIVWHAIDERDRDVPTLHSRCIARFRNIAPGIENLTPQYGYAPGEHAALVTNYLENALREHVFYILDDVQHLAGSPSAETWLRAFVEMMPAYCHMIVVSRILPDLPFAQMIARREVQAIGQEDLRFTSEEIKTLASASPNTGVNFEQVTKFATKLEGWPAGTVLTLNPLPAEIEKSMLRGGVGPEALFHELASVMLDAQPPDLRDFLLASSTLKRMTPQLCTEALGLSRSADWLADVQGNNLFIYRTPGGLTYHALFRSFLQETLQRQNRDYYVKMHIRAAEWFVRHDKIDDAFDHYMYAELYEEAIAISHHVAQSYFAQGKIETLLDWNTQLRDANVQGSRLLYTCAKIHTDRYEYDLAKVELDIAEEDFIRRDDPAGVADCQLQRAMIELLQGAYQAALERSQKLVDGNHDSIKLKGQALRILGFAHIRRGHIEEGSRYLLEALPLYRADGDKNALANLLLDLEIAYTRLGQFDKAAACLQEVVALRRDFGSRVALASALNNLGYYYHQHGSYAEAMSSFQEGLSIVARIPNKRAEGYLLWSMGDLQRDRGAFDEARQLYNKALELSGSSEPSLTSSILVSASTLRRWSGQYDEAITFAEKALELAMAHNLALEAATSSAAIQIAKAHLDDPEIAASALETIAHRLQEQGVQIERLHVCALQAQAVLLDGDADEAARVLFSAVENIQFDSGSSQLLVAEIVHSPSLYTIIKERPLKFDALLRAVDRLQTTQIHKLSASHGHSVHSATTTYSLRVFTLGKESIERDGEPVPSSSWRTATARDMFLYFLFQGATDRENFCLEFWADSHPEKVRKVFHTTLYRARHALGENVIIYENPLYRVNSEVDIWSDALEFESAVERARHLPSRDARTEDLWRRAVDLYQGDFLPSVDTEWINIRREALQEMYIEALVGLGACASARGDHRRAINAYKNALYVDPYRENIHRAIMMCYAQDGEPNKALEHFRDLEILFQNELGIAPSEQTISLVQSLLK